MFMNHVARFTGYLRIVCHILWLTFLWPIVAVFPRDRKKIIFSAWWGNQFADNTRYFLKYILQQNKGYKCYWFGKEHLRKQVEEVPVVFDLIHVGHLNILKRAKENCDWLIVGVSTDDLVLSYKHHLPIIPFEERL